MLELLLELVRGIGSTTCSSCALVPDGDDVAVPCLPCLSLFFFLG
ncbi:hypothetical protein RchiOBHm_Chr5g0016761 [Rosa chinensis]|uniref:Uncharacterized protein n=1 Tax=Rosa chinensis TaxID=74649 RepID=A0A2P6Q6A3_ROSCH|nr:hypothetical protein RchiOBHm_Chr5g0016761 [Rosa chinensis]